MHGAIAQRTQSRLFVSLINPETLLPGTCSRFGGGGSCPDALRFRRG
jgi:hypothetical protein